MTNADAGAAGGGQAGGLVAGGSAAGGSAAGGGVAGGSAGGVGSDAGVDAGAADSGCATLDFPESARLLQAFYSTRSSLHYVASGQPSLQTQPDGGALTDALSLELYSMFNWANPKLPVQTALGLTTLRDCTLCLKYLVGCRTPVACERTFFAQGGQFVLTRADRDPNNGALAARAADVELVEWDTTADLPKEPGTCLRLPAAGFLAVWGDAGVVTPAAFLDAGPDACAASQLAAATTVGCNGGFTTSMAQPNELHGSCAVDGGPQAGPVGSCVDPALTCLAPVRAPLGRCLQFCGAAATYVSTGGCPSGHRCVPQDKFNVPPGTYGVCARDCDATHPCPNGERCDTEGSCGF